MKFWAYITKDYKLAVVPFRDKTEIEVAREYDTVLSTFPVKDFSNIHEATTYYKGVLEEAGRQYE